MIKNVWPQTYILLLLTCITTLSNDSHIDRYFIIEINARSSFAICLAMENFISFFLRAEKPCVWRREQRVHFCRSDDSEIVNGASCVVRLRGSTTHLSE